MWRPSGARRRKCKASVVLVDLRGVCKLEQIQRQPLFQRDFAITIHDWCRMNAWSPASKTQAPSQRLFVHEEIDTTKDSPREPGSVQTMELMKEHTTTGWNSIVSLTTSIPQGSRASRCRR